MPVDAPVYNSPALGQGFSNLAQMFAPPSGTDMAGYANAQLLRQRQGLINQMTADPTGPNFDRFAVGAGLETGTNSFEAQNQNNATNLAKQANDQKLGEEQIIAQPQAPGTSSQLPPDLASMYKVPAQRTGNISVAPGEQVTPAFGGPVIKGQPVPMIAVDPMTGKFTYETPDQAIGQQAPPPPGSASGEFLKADAPLEAKAYSDLVDGGQQANGQLATLDQLDQASKGAGYTGVGGGNAMVLRKTLAAFGIDTTGESDAEVLQSGGNSLALQLLKGQGRLTGNDQAYITNIVPGINHSPTANAQLISAARAIAQRNIVLAQMASDYKNSHMGVFDQGDFNKTVVTPYTQAHPVFPQASDNQPGAPPAAPEGTVIGNGSQQFVKRGGKWVPST